MINTKEQVIADKVLEQLEMRIDLIVTKFINRKSNCLDSQKELDGIEGICRDIVNTLHPISAEKAEYVHEMFLKASELLKEGAGE